MDAYPENGWKQGYRPVPYRGPPDTTVHTQGRVPMPKPSQLADALNLELFKYVTLLPCTLGRFG